jgi:integrase
MARRKRSWGSIRKLPSGRYQVRYLGPDLEYRPAPVTFTTKTDASVWLAAEQTKISAGTWEAEKAPRRELPTVTGYVRQWISTRTTGTGEPLRPKTRHQYEQLHARHIAEDPIGAMTLDAVTAADVRDWWSRLPSDRPTWRAHAYRLLRAAFNSAVEEELVAATPCRIRSGGASKREREVRPATLPELDAITAAMPERYRAAVLLAAWCALRFGELTELRRSDVDLKAGVVHVRRAVVRVEGESIVGPPKSAAGVRAVAIPPHVLPVLAEHLHGVASARTALLFPSERNPQAHLALSTLARHFERARVAAGRPELRWHDLRHTGAVLAAQAGATLAELQGRLGHSSVAAALVYQHAADGRDAEIAKRMSRMIGA